MKRIFKVFTVLLVTVCFLIGCASTTLKTVWMDEAYKGGALKTVFIMAVTDKLTVKRFFEDEFVRELKARGIVAIASYTVIPEDKIKDKDFIASEIKKRGIESVLVTKLVDKKTVETDYPPEIRDTTLDYRGGWRGDASRGHSTYMPGMVVRDTVVVLETNVYEQDSDKPIFSAASETYMEDSPEAIIRSFVKLIIQELSQKKLIKA